MEWKNLVRLFGMALLLSALVAFLGGCCSACTTAKKKTPLELESDGSNLTEHVWLLNCRMSAHSLLAKYECEEASRNRCLNIGHNPDCGSD